MFEYIPTCIVIIEGVEKIVLCLENWSALGVVQPVQNEVEY
jgi:hypothetical protein